MILNFLIFIIGLEHFYFLIMEMFLWTKPRGLKTFNLTQDFANASATLAANQGLYNGFLAGGLFYSLYAELSPETADQFQYFFLICVAIAGAFGGYTVSKKIFYMQAGPAILALSLKIFFYS